MGSVHSFFVGIFKSCFVTLRYLIGYVTHVFIQEDISESNQDLVNTFQDEIGPIKDKPHLLNVGIQDSVLLKNIMKAKWNLKTQEVINKI